MKKLLSLLLAASVVSCGATAFAAQSKFKDISDEKYAWAKTAIEDMAEQGYINGYEDNTFGPDNKVTRLDTILLFSRAMGANREENKEIVEQAKEKYATLVKSTGISYGHDEVSFMLARGVLSEEDVKTFLSDGKATKPMPRQEAAAIITKAMCGEDKAKEEVLIDLEYTDAKQIAPGYSQYVFYVSENKIMNGMDDGSFGPESSVLRSQIAVMLSRTVDKMNLYIETVLVTDIDTENNNITIVDSEDAEDLVGYTDYTKFFDGLELSSESKFKPFSKAMLTYINNNTAFVDMYEKQIDESSKGVYQGAVTDEGMVTVTIKPDGEKEAKEYALSSKAIIYGESGSEITLKNIAPNSYIEYEAANGVIVSLKKINKASYINGATIESISIDDDLYLVISHSDSQYDGMKFVLTDNIAVYKNNDRSDLSKIYKGDRIDITLEYGEITKIVATSNTKTYEGTISEVIISSNPEIKVKINGELSTFAVVPNIAITINGEEGTLYDLRVGDTVKITIESGAVLKIVTTSAAVSSEPVSGVVEIVNTSMGFIKINGETIFCKDSKTTIINSKGDSKSMKDLKEGVSVSVRGSMQNGAYNASLIIIEE